MIGAVIIVVILETASQYTNNHSVKMRVDEHAKTLHI